MTLDADEYVWATVVDEKTGERQKEFVRLSDLKMGHRRRERLPTHLRRKLPKIKSLVDDVYPMSLKKWEDGFCCDTHPEREIELWLAVGHNLSLFTKACAPSARQKCDAFRVIIALSMGAPTDCLKQGALTEEQFKALLVVAGRLKMDDLLEDTDVA